MHRVKFALTQLFPPPEKKSSDTKQNKTKRKLAQTALKKQPKDVATSRLGRQTVIVT